MHTGAARRIMPLDWCLCERLRRYPVYKFGLERRRLPRHTVRTMRAQYDTLESCELWMVMTIGVCCV